MQSETTHLLRARLYTEQVGTCLGGVVSCKKGGWSPSLWWGAYTEPPIHRPTDTTENITLAGSVRFPLD